MQLFGLCTIVNIKHNTFSTVLYSPEELNTNTNNSNDKKCNKSNNNIATECVHFTICSAQWRKMTAIIN